MPVAGTERAWSWLDGLLRDVRFAARGLRRTPAFTVAAIASLALGFALVTSAVAVVNAYLVRTVPYPEAERLYHVMYAPPGPWEPRGLTGLDWTSVGDVVEQPIAASGDSFYYFDAGYTVSLRGLRVTRGFVAGLGVAVSHGRSFVETDFLTGAEPVALLGHGLWRERFGSAPDAIGRTIQVGAESAAGRPQHYRIVGVLSPGFYFGRDSRAPAELMVPHGTALRAYMVRLRDRVPPEPAARRLTDAVRRAATSPIPESWTGVTLESVRDRWIGNLRPVLAGITIAVGLVAVIVCANVAVLVLLRSSRRRKEVAVRMALGSGWRHVARLVLAEAGLIALVSLAAGIAMAAVAMGTLSPLVEAQFGRPAPSATGIGLDATVLFVVGAACALVTFVLALTPAVSWGRGLAGALQEDTRVASDGRAMRRVRRALIAFEVAGSLVLLVACGLMIRSVVRMIDSDLGFAPEGLARSRVMLRVRNYANAEAYRGFHERFAATVAGATASPVVFSNWPPFAAPPSRFVQTDAGGAAAGSMEVGAGYFTVFSIPLKEGREFTQGEALVRAPVAVISETLAARLWPSGGAFGARVREVEETPSGQAPGPWRTVVGIARDVRQSYDDGDRADFYKPGVPEGRFGTFYVRTDRPMPRLFDDLRSAAAGIDRDAVINPPRIVADDDQALAGTRFLASVLTGFAALSAALAILGIYGVTAYAVQQRHHEVAIRVALGAPARAIVGMFVREGVLLLTLGTLAGLGGAAAAARVLSSRVFGVDRFDPATFAAACALLVAAGVATVLAAARRAARTDAASALKSA
jgi:putative ABC transport system permease protein